jgi:hypothetical protein
MSIPLHLKLIPMFLVYSIFHFKVILTVGSALILLTLISLMCCIRYRIKLAQAIPFPALDLVPQELTSL